VCSECKGGNGRRNVSDEEGLILVLKASLDKQQEPRRQMFLHVAALLSRHQKLLVLDVWGAQHGAAAGQYLKDLERHSLLGCNAEGNITTHDVLRYLGRHLRCFHKKYSGSCLWVELVKPQMPQVCSCALHVMGFDEADSSTVVRRHWFCIVDPLIAGLHL
jgi:hypothetical protein